MDALRLGSRCYTKQARIGNVKDDRARELCPGIEYHSFPRAISYDGFRSIESKVMIIYKEIYRNDCLPVHSSHNVISYLVGSRTYPYVRQYTHVLDTSSF